MAKKPVRRSAAKKPAPRKSAPQSTSKPTHSVNWAKLESSPQFIELKRAKVAFIVPAVVFFIAYYFALPVLVGYAPALMATKVFGAMNLGYVFALSQFLMAWIIAALYVRAASRFDEQAAEVAGFATQGGRA
jgi:uncharacterized membrane protein (DUF485 family)